MAAAVSSKVAGVASALGDPLRLCRDRLKVGDHLPLLTRILARTLECKLFEVVLVRELELGLCGTRAAARLQHRWLDQSGVK